VDPPPLSSLNYTVRCDPYNNTQTTEYTDLNVTVVEPMKQNNNRGPRKRHRTERATVLTMTADNVRRVLGDDAPQDPESSSSEEDEEPQYASSAQHRESRQATRSSHPSDAYPRWDRKEIGRTTYNDQYQAPPSSYRAPSVSWKPDTDSRSPRAGPDYTLVRRHKYPMAQQVSAQNSGARVASRSQYQSSRG
jgi:hypothetical protein